MGKLYARLVGRDLITGAYLGSIPTPLEASAQILKHEQSTCTVSYPIDGVRDDLIGRDGAVWALEIAEDQGEWIEPPNCRFFTSQTGDDQLARVRVWQISGVHVGWRLLMGEIVGREGTINEDGYRVISAATPGQILRQLITTAKARSAPSGLEWAESVELNFTNTHDSAGNPWPTTHTLTLPVQRFIGEVLTDLADDLAVEFEWRGMELYVTGPGGLSRDRTTGRNPTILRPFNVTESPRTSTLVDSCTDVDFAGDEGFAASFGEPDAFAPLGRLVKPVSQGQTTTIPTAQRRAEVVLRTGQQPRVQDSRAGSNATGGPLPILDIRPGDTVRLDTPRGPIAPVVGATVTFGAKDTRWHWTLGTVLDSQLARARKKADLALAGAGVVGGDGTAPRPPGPDMRVPEKVVGLVAAPDTYIGADGAAVGRVILGWTEVEHATDGTVIESLEGYQVWGRTTGETTRQLITTVPGDATIAEVDRLRPGSNWEYQVRAVSLTQVFGAFSDLVPVVIEDDLEAPYVPTPPVLTAIAGTVTVRWDGYGVGPVTGDPMPMQPDLARILVWSYGDDPANTATYLGALNGSRDGDIIIETGIASGATRYYALSAVDRSGNESARSTVVSVVGRSVADDPEIINDIGAELVADTAWIGNLQAVVVVSEAFEGKVFTGGIFRAPGPDGSRVEFREDGYFQYDPQGKLVASWTPQHGFRLFDHNDGGVTAQLGYLSDGSTTLAVRDDISGDLVPLAGVAFGTRGSRTQGNRTSNLSGSNRDSGWMLDTASDVEFSVRDRAFITMSVHGELAGNRAGIYTSYYLYRNGSTYMGPTTGSVVLTNSPSMESLGWSGDMVSRHPVELPAGTYVARLCYRNTSGLASGSISNAIWSERSLVIDPV